MTVPVNIDDVVEVWYRDILHHTAKVLSIEPRESILYFRIEFKVIQSTEGYDEGEIFKWNWPDPALKFVPVLNIFKEKFEFLK